MATIPRDPITCHVLDTTTGRPGASISVSLLCASEPATLFAATTNSDGRVANWGYTVHGDVVDSTETGPAVTQKLNGMIQKYAAKEIGPGGPKGSSTWKLKFDTGAYYGVDRTFFPTVELTFLVKEGEHFHVPLLLGPYSFTTYRGS